jgi:hypothetical protein
MEQPEIDRLRREVTDKIGLEPVTVDVLHSWALSHVERLTVPGAGTVIFKCATEPFTHEDEALTSAWQAGVDVPRLHASSRGATTLGMLLEDLGQPRQQATEIDGVAAAVQLHSAAIPDFLAPGDTSWLASLPSRALRTLNVLREDDRWTDTDDIAHTLAMLQKAAPTRAEGATKPPYGWVHSEFHPTSLLVGSDRTYMYDLARAFHGPGLLDLASWHGTIEPANPAAVRHFLERYVEAGGSEEALHTRGGLTAQNWALGWHRVWIVEWYLAQAALWIAHAPDDQMYARVVRAHLVEAAELLNV